MPDGLTYDILAGEPEVLPEWGMAKCMAIIRAYESKLLIDISLEDDRLFKHAWACLDRAKVQVVRPGDFEKGDVVIDLNQPIVIMDEEPRVLTVEYWSRILHWMHAREMAGQQNVIDIPLFDSEAVQLATLDWEHN